MKKSLLIDVYLLIISVLFVVLATSCKKDSDDDSTITDIDGNVYNTVAIASQVWLKENLKTTKFKDGAAIPNVTSDSEWGSINTPGFCWYDNDQAANKNKYGALYNWYTVNTGKLCPEGWHVPTDSDWTELINELGGEIVAANKLKSTTGWYENGNGTNESGFTGVPAGYRYSNAAFWGVTKNTHWWTANEADGTNANTVGLEYDPDEIYRDPDGKTLGFSVRCIKN